MKKNILIFLPKFSLGGGIESWLNYFIINLQEEYNISVLTMYNSNKILNDKCTYYSLNEEKIYFNKYNYLNRLKTIYSRLRLIGKIQKEKNIVTIITAGNIPNLMGVFYKIFNKKINIITSIHNSFFLKNRFEKIILFLSQVTNKTIFVSREAEYLALKVYKLKHSETIYNFSKSNKYIVKQSTNHNKYVSIGRLDKNKNHIFLIHAFNKYIQQGVDISLDIIGTGPEESSLHKTVKKLGIEKHVSFLGEVTNIEDTIYEYQYLCMTSHFEGFPTVFIEAIKNGVPIITLDFQTGAKEIIRGNQDFSACKQIEAGNCGILIPKDNQKKFLEGINFSRKNKFNKESILNFYNKNFNNLHIKNMWIKII